MLKLAKLVAMFFVALLLQVMPFTSQSSFAQQAKDHLTINVTATSWHLKPGETATINVDIDKLKPSDKIEINLKTTPLLVRTEEAKADATSMSQHATLYVTAPNTLKFKTYHLVVTASNGYSKPQKSKLNFEVNDGEGGSPQLYISEAYTTADFDFHLGGLGYGAAPKVIVNGKDISDKIVASTNNTVDMKGTSLEDFNLIQHDYDPVTNDVIIVVDGKSTNNIHLIIGPRYPQ